MMLYLTYSLNALLMLLLPIGLAVFLTRKFRLSWRLFWIGAVTFIASQVVHLPLNFGLTALFRQGVLPSPAYPLVFDALVLGLTAGISEELARYFVYRWWIKSARTWGEALLFGVGHGGIEAIILGGLAGLAFIQMIGLREADLATLIPPEQLAQAQAQVTAYWSLPWYASLLGAVERIFALCLHLSLAVMVLQVFKRRRLGWLAGAIGWHALVDAVAVFSVSTWGIYPTEAIIGLFALGSLAILFLLRPRQPETLPPTPGPILGTPPSGQPRVKTEDELAQQLERSRYIE